MDESVCLRWNEFPVNLGAFSIPFIQPKEQQKKHRVEKWWLETNTKKELRKTERSKRAYHELQMTDMTFDAHSAFIAPTHRKRLRAVHMCNWTTIMIIFGHARTQRNKRGGGGGGGGGAFEGICDPTQVAEWCLV
jgi:hypothetical protein